MSGAPYSAFEAFLQERLRGGKPDFDGVFCVTDSLVCLPAAYAYAGATRA